MSGGRCATALTRRGAIEEAGEEEENNSRGVTGSEEVAGIHHPIFLEILSATGADSPYVGKLRLGELDVDRWLKRGKKTVEVMEGKCRDAINSIS